MSNDNLKRLSAGATAEGGGRQNAGANLSDLTITHTQANYKLLKAEDVARVLNISRTAAYRLMRGELPAVKFGGTTVRVRQSDLEAFIAAHITGGGE